MKRSQTKEICDRKKHKASASPSVIFLQTNYTPWRMSLLYFLPAPQ